MDAAKALHQVLIPFLLTKLHSAGDVVPGRIAKAYGTWFELHVYLTHVVGVTVQHDACHVLDKGLRPLQGILHAFQCKPTTFGLSLLACLLLLGAVNSHLHKFLLAQLCNMWNYK